MRFMRTLIFYAGWIFWTSLVGVLALPTILSRRAVWKAAHIWAQGTVWWLRIASGITSTVQHMEYLNGARIVASRHQSAWDTLMLWCVLKNPMFVLKRELYWIPIFGWYLWRTGQIGINRAQPKDAILRIISAMRRPENQSRTLVIFPEGTRTPPGVHRPFRPGIARVSAALTLPVVPAALNAGKFWPKRPLWQYPGNAILAFLAPVEAATEENLSAWLETLQEQIETASQRL